MNIRCIADPRSSLGFLLAGIKTDKVSSREEAIKAVTRATEDSSAGIVLITTDVTALLGEAFEKYFFSATMPFFIEIPSNGSQDKPGLITRLLKKTVGIGV
ncbi:MAG: V-type ATP synthase subunit F [Candidatus Ratteibacteria bacterium]|jgi:vacuolar-type H+-ATPase subunit F/Vma7